MMKIRKKAKINMKKLPSAVLKKLWVVILIALIGGAAAFSWTVIFDDPQYEASVLMYINSGADENVSDDTYDVILHSRTTIEEIIAATGLEYNYEELSQMIQLKSVKDTVAFTSVVKCDDPEEAGKVAEAITVVYPKRVSEIVEGSAVIIVDGAVLSPEPVYTHYFVNAIWGAAAAAVVCLIILMIAVTKDVHIRDKKYMEYAYDIPVLACLPRFKSNILCDKLNGARGEAYKRLRANLGFSFAQSEGGKVIGITSALRKEGKSTTAINLAYSMAQTGKKVLLIDGDMRYPSISSKLNIVSKTGLPDMLAGTGKREDAITHMAFPSSGVEFDVVSTGEISAISSELLGCERMRLLLEDLKAHYSYIFVDLPSACKFSDASVFSQYADGMLMTVRENYSKSYALDEALANFEFADANVIGFVYF